MTLSASNSEQVQTVETGPQAAEMAAVLGQYRTETGRTLLALLDESPLLLIFLRHFVCSFCRQALGGGSRVWGAIGGEGNWTGLRPPRNPGGAKPYFDYFQLSDVERVS